MLRLIIVLSYPAIWYGLGSSHFPNHASALGVYNDPIATTGPEAWAILGLISLAAFVVWLVLWVILRAVGWVMCRIVFA